MPYMLIRHNVEDYAAWKRAFVDVYLPTAREASGVKSIEYFRNTDHPQELVVFLEVEEPAKARGFGQSESLRRAMQQAGVVGEPEISLLESLE